MPHFKVVQVATESRQRLLPTSLRRCARVVVALGLSALVTACGTTSVSLKPPNPTDATVMETCSTLKDSIPARLRGLHKVATSPASDLTAAWSDAANSIVTLRCGVESFDTATSDILSVNDVDWAPTQRDRGTSFVTVGRQVTVQVDIPATLRPEASYLVPLADAIAAAVPLTN